jgi:hypothetical protein
VLDCCTWNVHTVKYCTERSYRLCCTRDWDCTWNVHTVKYYTERSYRPPLLYKRLGLYMKCSHCKVLYRKELLPLLYKRLYMKCSHCKVLYRKELLPTSAVQEIGPVQYYLGRPGRFAWSWCLVCAGFRDWGISVHLGCPEGGKEIFSRHLHWSWHSYFLRWAGCLCSGVAFPASHLLEAGSLTRLSCLATRLQDTF